MLAWWQNLLGAASEQCPPWISLEEMSHGMHQLLLSCAVIFCTWPLYRKVGHIASSSYRNLPEHKQWYVVANISKTVCLALISLQPFFYQEMWHVFRHQSFIDDNAGKRAKWVKSASAVYISTDLMALLLVPKLPKTTVAHHWIACILCVCLFLTKLSDANITMMIALYGAWSSLTWPVNLFLAFRCMNNAQWWLQHLARFALVLYFFGCSINWTWHATWFLDQLFYKSVFREPHGLLIVAYIMAVFVVARDDIILMKWLLGYTAKNM